VRRLFAEDAVLLFAGHWLGGGRRVRNLSNRPPRSKIYLLQLARPTGRYAALVSLAVQIFDWFAAAVKVFEQIARTAGGIKHLVDFSYNRFDHFFGPSSLSFKRVK
jgi:hypothetical protein